MNIDELKLEANKLGYRLTKIPEKIYMSPCVCGSKRREQWWDKDGTFYKCCKCEIRGYSGKTIRQAKIGWNDAILEESKHND